MNLEQAEARGAYVVAGYVDFRGVRLADLPLSLEPVWHPGKLEWFLKETEGAEDAPAAVAETQPAPTPAPRRQRKAAAPAPAPEPEPEDAPPADDQPDLFNQTDE
jgi:hypothetical protein